MEGDKENSKNKSIKRTVKRKAKPSPSPEQEHPNEPIQTMKKKNLQIEVIEHPEANQKVEEIILGDGSELESEEPNHREGTLGPQPTEEAEGEYVYEEESEEEEGDYDDQNEPIESNDDDNGPKQSLQSFGNNSGRKEKKAKSKVEEAKIKQNAANNSGIQAHHLNEFLKKSNIKDPMNKTTKLSPDQLSNGEGEEGEDIVESMPNEGDENPDDENFEEDMDDPLADDEMIRKQQMEAEALLQETRKEVEEVEQDDEPSLEEEEAEHLKHTEDNKYGEEIEPEEEEQEDNDENEDNAGINTKDNKFSLNYTVGRIEDGAAILISKDHNLIEIPL